MNLLIVNDEIITADMMKNEILWNNYGISETVVAYSAESAKKVIKDKHIDLILCDIEMPMENGLSLLQWIREKAYDIECIFLTCHANFVYAQKAIELGCQNYILIPASYEKIGECVSKVVRRITEKRENIKYQEYGKEHLMEQVKEAVKDNVQISQHDLVCKATACILEHLGQEELSVSFVAEQINIHPVYLNRIFKKEKGIPVSQYIIGERMKLAGKLLKAGTLDANIIANKVGYRNYPNFNVTFRKYYGCSPTQYQKKELYKE